jgi:hypothetical protein
MAAPSSFPTARSIPDGTVVHFAGRGDAINAVLAALGYNFRLLIRWLRFLLHRILLAFAAITQFNPA